MPVFVDKDDVQVAAIAQFLAAQFAVANDGNARTVAVALLHARPTPAGRHAQHRVGQRAQIVGHFFDRELAFEIARQGAEHLGVVGAAQQVEQFLLVVFTGRLQGGQPRRKLLLELRGVETLEQHLGAGELVDHAGVLEQIARRPARRPEQAQQPLVHRRALLQQGQVTLAPEQRLDPVGHAQTGGFADAALVEPGTGALDQPHQAHPRVFAQGQETGLLDPQRDALGQHR